MRLILKLSAIALLVLGLGRPSEAGMIVGSDAFTGSSISITANGPRLDTATAIQATLQTEAGGNGDFSASPGATIGPVEFDLASGTLTGFANGAYGTFTSTSIEFARGTLGGPTPRYILDVTVRGTFTPAFGAFSPNPNTELTLTFAQNQTGSTAITLLGTFANLNATAAVPEPSTIALLGTSLFPVGLAVIRRRRLRALARQ